MKIDMPNPKYCSDSCRQEAKQRQIRKPNSVVENLPPQNLGKVCDKLGKKAKVSGKTYRKGKQIKDKNPE